MGDAAASPRVFAYSRIFRRRDAPEELREGTAAASARSLTFVLPADTAQAHESVAELLVPSALATSLRTSTPLLLRHVVPFGRRDQPFFHRGILYMRFVPVRSAASVIA